MSQYDYIKYKTIILKLLNDSPLLIPYGDYTSYNVYYLVSSIQNTKDAYNNLLPPNTISIFNIPKPFLPTSSTVVLSPYGLTGIRNTSSSITITFIPTSEIVDAYTVTAVPSDGETVVQIFPGYYDTYTITNLQAGMVYSISIIATMSTVNSEPSNTLLYSTILSSLSELIISNITDSTLDISFNQPSGSITSYEVTAKSASGNVGPQIFYPPATTYTITGLQSNVSYTISIVVKNSIQDSPPFETTQSYRTLLPSPQNLSGSSTSGSTIFISYTAPTIGTTYTYNISTTPTGTVAIPQNISATSYNITGLQTNLLYTIRVVANSANGNYSLPATLNYRTLLPPPSNFTYTNRTSTTISVSFTEPPGTIDTYRITATSIYGAITPQNFNAPSTSYTITGLQSGILYTITIFAIIDNISSAASIPFVYSTLLLPPENVTYVERTNSSIAISFTESAGQVNKYTVFAKPVEGDTVSKEFTQPQTLYLIDNLQSGMSYEIWVIAMNDHISSSKSASIVKTTILSPPTDLSVNTITYSSMHVSFVAPSSGSITKYTITATPTSGQPVVQDISGNTTSTTLALDSNTYYTIQVVASNAYEISAPLLSSTSYRTLLPPPSNLQPINRTDTSIGISFDAPNDGNTYTYDITTLPIQVGSSVQQINNTTYTINGLDSGVLYTIYVKTTNSSSNVSIPISTTYTTLLLPPRNLYVNTSTITDSALDISFDAPLRGTIIKYIVTANAADGSTRTKDNVVTTSTTLDQLQAGMQYTISVVAYSIYTNSVPLVSDASYNTLLSPPRNLYVNTTTITDSTIDISFNPPLPGAVIKYSVNATPASGLLVTKDISGTVTATSIIGLQSGMNYTINVVAYSMYTNSVPLVSDTSYNTLLLPPRNLYVNTSTITDSVIDISFNAPLGGTIIKYSITATPASGLLVTTDISGTITSTAIHGLDAGMNYTISVVAYSIYTNSVPLVSDTSYNTLLPPPRNLYVNTSTITDSTIDISFNPPSLGTVSKYILTANAADGSSITKNNITTTTPTIDGLLAGMNYTISVVAYSMYTNSVPLVSDASYNTLLPPPRNLYVNTSTITDSTIDISFNPPLPGAIIKYSVNATPASGLLVTKDISGTVTSTAIHGLEAGMNYTISVVAYTMYTNSVPLVSDTSYNTLLPPPRNLYVNTNTITDATIDISFNTPTSGSISSYTVIANAADGSSITKNNITTTTPTIDGLEAGMTYGINVIAYTAYTNSLPLVSDASYNTLLPPPRNLIVNTSTITDDAIDISFNAPLRGSIIKYSIQANPASGLLVTNDISGTITSTTIHGLEAGMKYGINVIAYTMYTNSVPLVSDTSYNTLLPPPTNLYVDSATITDASMNVSFNAPTRGSISSYTVIANAADGSIITKNDVVGTSTTIDGLLAGMSYIIHVIAYTIYTNSVLLISSTSYNTLLPPPRNLIVNTSTITDSAIDISFNAPLGGTINKYSVNATPASGLLVTNDISGTITATTIHGLEAGMNYTINVVAYTIYTNSVPLVSDTSYNTLLPPPRNLYVNTSTITDSAIDISFNTPLHGSVTKYTITAIPIVGESTTKDINGVSTTINGLLAGMTYTIRVFAVNNYTNSVPLVSDASYNTLLPPPTNLYIDTNTITDTSMNVAFTAPSRGSVTKYTIIAYPYQGNNVIFYFYGFQSAYEITGLQDNMAYSIGVIASSDYTNSQQLLSGTTYTTLLPPPTNLYIDTNTITDASMNISFTASSNNTVTNYEASALSSSGNVGPQSFTGTAYTLIGLTYDTSYNVRVIAKNANNNFSLPLLSALSYRTLLPQPTYLHAVGRTYTSIDISFNPPSNGITYTYNITTLPYVSGSSIVHNINGTYTINGLQSGILYTIRVNTTNSNGNVSLPITIQYATLLLPPTDLLAISSTFSSIVVSFTESNGYFEKHRIYAQSANGQTVTKEFTQSQLSYEIDGLQSGMYYTLWVVAINTNITSEQSNSITYTTQLPSPTITDITNISDSSIYVVFTAPPTGSVTNYTITATKSNGSQVSATTSVTSVTLNGLEPGMSYTISLIATNTYISSQPYIINDYNTILSSPRNLIVPSNTITYESIGISFTAPSGGVLYTYEVTSLSDSGNVGPQVFTGTSYIITGLQSNTLYTISIIAKTADGNYSLPLVSATSYRTLLPPPSNLIPVGSTDTTIDISFNTPNDGNTYSYNITTDPVISGSNVQSNVNGTYTITGLESGRLYTISVNTTNSTSNYSLPITTTYNTLLLPPTNLQATSSTSSSIFVSFTETVGYQVMYEITAQPDAGNTIKRTFNQAQLSYEIDGLQSGMKYIIFVNAKNTNTTSQPSASIEYNTILPPPTSLTVSNFTDSTMDVSFNKTSSGEVVQYVVTAIPVSGSNVIKYITVTPPGSATESITMDTLQAGMSYTIQVVAINMYTYSVALTNSGYKTLLLPPSGLIVDTITDASMNISFTAPSAGIITKYRINAIPANGLLTVTKDITVTSTTLGGLQAGMSYTLSVIAFTIYTQSVALTSDTSYNTILPPPSGLVVSNITDTSMNIAFTAPSRGIISKYTVSATPTSGSLVTKDISGNVTSTTLSGLLPDTSYTIRVVAFSVYTQSNALVSDTTHNTLLSPPTNVVVNTITDSSMNITITQPSGGSSYTYEVTALSASGDIGPQSFSGTTYTIVNLNDDTLYTLSIVSRTMTNYSLAFLSTASYRTLLLPPSNLQLSGGTNTAVSVSFTAPSNGITYTYDISTIPIRVGSTLQQNSLTNYTILGLESGVLYTIYVNTRNASGNISPQRSIAYTTILLPPTNVQATSNVSSFVVSFTATSGVVDKYEITAEPIEGVSIVNEFTTYQPNYTISGLQSGMLYSIWVRAINAIIVSNKSNIITNTTLLSPPTNLYVDTNSITDASMNISFTAPSAGNITKYRVNAIPANGLSTVSKDITQTSTTIEELQAGMSYTLSVVAYTTYTQSVALLSDTSYNTILPPPSGLVVSNITDTSMNVSFTAPSRGIISKYTITATPSSGPVVIKDISGNVTSTTITGLQGGMSYTLSVVAYTNYTQSLELAPGTVYNTVLPPPTSLSVTGITDASMNVAFTAPSSGTVTKYTITATAADTTIVTKDISGNVTSTTLDGLQTGMSYTLSVIAYTTYTQSVALAPGTVYNTILPPPTALSVTGITDASMNVSFTASTGGIVTKYTITATAADSTVVTKDISGNVTSTTLDGLDAGMSYTLSVVAYTAYTQSVALAPGTLYTTTLPPPTALSVGTITDTSIDVSFNAPNYGTIMKYSLTATPSSGLAVTKDISGNITSTTITGLQGGMSYTLSVVAYTAYTQSVALAPGTIYTTILPPPTALSVTGITDVSMDIAFTAPTGGTITKYTITATAADSTFVTKDISGNITSTTLSGLQVGMSYTLSVVAYTAYTLSVALAPGTLYTTILPPPTSLSVTGITDSSMNVAFTAPTGGIVTEYTITATAADLTIVTKNISGNVTSTTLDGLDAGMSYTVTVVAYTAYTPSAALAPGTVYNTTLPPPTSLSVTSITDASFNVSFTAPTNVTLSKYTITATPASGTVVTKDISGNITSTLITGLQAGMSYTVSVVAYTAYTNSAALAPGTVYYTVLPPPTGLKQNGSASTTIDISFNPPTRGTITKYTVNTINNGNTVPQIFTVPTSIYRITGLSTGTIYTINMYASTAYTDSALTSNITYSTILSPPTNLIASNVTGSSMTISFTPPAGTVTSYTLSVSPTPSGGFTGIIPGTDTSYNLTGLSGFTTYTISMTATNGVVTSVASTSITPTTSLSPPTGLTATGFTSNSITIAFNLVSGATSYTAQAVPYSGNTVVTPSFTSSPYTISSLQPGMSYDISIYVTKSGVNSAYSASIPYNTKLITPTNIACPSKTDTSITITFTSPSDRIVDSYGIKVAEFNSGLPTYYPAKQASYTITGLTGDAFCTITVFAKNANGVSDDSNIFYQFTLLSAPTSIVATLTNSTINVSFVKSGNTVIYGKVVARPTSGDTVIQRFFQPNTNFNIMGYITQAYYNDLLYFYQVYSYNNLINERSANEPCGLQPNTLYTITMIMGNNTGDSAESTSVQVTTPALSPPSGLSVTSTTSTTINITFTATPSTIDTYVVTATPINGGTIVRQVISKTATTYTITGLIIDTTYNILLYAIRGSVMTTPISTTGTATGQWYTNVTFPDTYATFVLSSTWSSGNDIYTNTSRALTVSGATTYKNGTYTVSSSSAYSSYAVPYFVFCNANTTSSPWWATGGTTITTPNVDRTLISTGYQTFSQSGYTLAGVYQGGGSTASTFSTTYNTSSTASGEWIQMQFPYKIKLTSFSFYPRGGGYTKQDRNPKSGFILGSNDGTTWSLIHTYSSGTLTGNTGPFTFAISTSTGYTYIRFVITALYGTTEGVFVSITKLYYTGDVYA